MIDKTKIIEVFGGMIGWRQNVDPIGEQLSEAVLASSTGQYYEDYHPMVTIDNILSMLKEDEDLSTWIKNKTDAFIIQAFNDWFYKKSKLKTGNSVLAYNLLFGNAGDSSEAADVVLVSEGERVGLRIQTGKSLNTKHVIHSIALHFEQNTTVTLVVRNVQTGEDVATKVINYEGSGNQQWHDADITLKGGGEYLIEYIVPSTLNAPISGMSGIEMPYTKLYKVEGVQEGETINENFGIDIKMSVSCDYTDLILDQRDLFVDLIGKRVAMGLLREMVYNPNARHNRHEKNVNDQQLLYEIDGDSQGNEENNNGLANQYEKALNALGFDRSRIDKICLPCQRHGLRYTTTG